MLYVMGFDFFFSPLLSIKADEEQLVLSSKLWDFSSRNLSKEVFSYNSSLDFSTGCFRQRVGDEDLLGDLESCQILPAIPKNLCLLNLRSVSRNYCTIYLLETQALHQKIRKSRNVSSRIGRIFNGHGCNNYKNGPKRCPIVIILVRYPYVAQSDAPFYDAICKEGAKAFHDLMYCLSHQRTFGGGW